MLRQVSYVVLLFSLTCGAAFGADTGKKEEGEAKEISGMSIVGNNETPTSLVIVPWKSSEIGQETKLKSNLLNDDMSPVDRAVFTRELNFYNLANPK
ncbi:MAG TPA: hypothetical protein VIU93_10780 [Gallionellaceae bacterium]